MGCFLTPAVLPLLGICYLAWGSSGIQGCAIPALPVLSKVLLLVFVQLAPAPIALTLAREETNDFSFKELAHRVAEMPLYSRPLFFFFFLIIENFLILCLHRVHWWCRNNWRYLTVTIFVTWVWIRSSSLDSKGCLTYSECFRWFEKYSCCLQNAKCRIYTTFFPAEVKPKFHSLQLFRVVHASQEQFNYLTPTQKSGRFSSKIPWSILFSSLNSLSLRFLYDANPFVSVCLSPRRLDSDSGVLC